MSRLYPCVYCTEDGYCEKFSDKEVTSWCVQGPCKDEKPSNGDRIRAMTDEELANLINRIEPKFCHDGWDYMIGCDEDKDCVICWLDWLKQEVDDAEIH